MLGRILCLCRYHRWSAVAPGDVHIMDAQYAMIAVSWTQIGTMACQRLACSEVRTVVRNGSHGHEGLSIDSRWVRDDQSLDTITAQPKYRNDVALEKLGALVPA